MRCGEQHLSTGENVGQILSLCDDHILLVALVWDVHLLLLTVRVIEQGRCSHEVCDLPRHTIRFRSVDVEQGLRILEGVPSEL